MQAEGNPLQLALITIKLSCLSDPMKAAQPLPSCQLRSWQLGKNQLLASSPSPHCGVWGGGSWDGHLAWVPISIHALPGHGTETCPVGAQGTLDMGRPLWAPVLIRTTFPGQHGCPCVHDPLRALELLAWSPAGSWPSTHLGIRLVHLASRLAQSILEGLEVDGAGGIQGSLREERRRFWDWHPN